MNNNWLLALGGNLPTEAGPPEITLGSACAALNQGPLELISVSRIFSSPCFPAGAGPDYANMAVAVRTALSAQDVLAHVHLIEAEFGRARVQRWGMRTLDIDLIGCQDLVLPTVEAHTQWRELPSEEQVKQTPDELILPHPRIQDRAFVLVPLCDIAATWIHPVLGRSVSQLCDALPETDRNALKPI